MASGLRGPVHLVSLHDVAVAAEAASNPAQICFRLFEDIAVFFETYSSFIPITFMLGFYVSAVFGRWNDIFNSLGWIDTCVDLNFPLALLTVSRIRYLAMAVENLFLEISIVLPVQTSPTVSDTHRRLRRDFSTSSQDLCSVSRSYAGISSLFQVSSHSLFL